MNATAKECAIKTRPRRWIVRASEERRVRGGERKNGLSPWCTIYTRVHESLKIRRDAMQFISDDHSSNKQLARNRLRAINRYLLESFLTTNDDFVIFFFFFFFFSFFQFRNFLLARVPSEIEIYGRFFSTRPNEALIELQKMIRFV